MNDIPVMVVIALTALSCVTINTLMAIVVEHGEGAPKTPTSAAGISSILILVSIVLLGVSLRGVK